MVLYHAVSVYQLLWSIVHYKIFNKEKRSTIMLSEYLAQKHPNFMELETIFDQVIVVEQSKIVKQIGTIENDVLDYFDKLFKKQSINICDFAEIYNGCSHNYLGIYLVKRNISFHLVEDASGLLSRPAILVNIEKNLFHAKHVIAEKYGLYNGQNKLIKKKYCNLNTQVEGFYDEKAVHFDLVSYLKDLPEEFIKKLLNFFNVDYNYDFQKDTAMIFTQHFANLNIMSFEDQVLIYQLLVDYFLNDYNLVIKPHSDDLVYYDKLFPGSYVIRDKFPSELLPFIVKQRPKLGCTISSTVIYNISTMFENILEFDVDYEKSFKATHRYYVIHELIQASKEWRELPIYGCGVNDKLFNNLTKEGNKKLVSIHFEDLLLNKSILNGILIIDKLNEKNIEQSEEFIDFLENLPPNVFVFFINSNEDFCFYNRPDKHLFNSICPIAFYKKKIRDVEVYEKEEEEVIYFYSKRSDIKEMLTEIKIDKELKNTGIELSTIKMSPEEMRIKVLEGILEATEKRLLHYIRKNEELKQQLNTNQKM